MTSVASFGVFACGARSSLDEFVSGDVPEEDAGLDARAPAPPGADASDSGALSIPRDAAPDASPPAVAPRPIAPLSTSRVTSHRPTLRWALPNGVGAATLDLCLDRACTRPIGAPAYVSGSTYVPASDLPVGVVYWRLHPSRVTTVSSPTWEFTVGARSAPVDTSWGTTLDVNGDGYADLVVDAPGTGATGAVYLYFGSAAGLVTSATLLAGPSGANGFGVSVASASDVNGDGYADLVVGGDGTSVSTTTAYVYLGGASGLGSSPATTLTYGGGLEDGGAPGPADLSVASAGDVNGDGYADVVVGASFLDGDEGEAFVYLGGARGISTTPAASLVASPCAASPEGPGTSLGSSVASAGDVNGDGYADIVVGSYDVSVCPGAAYVYLGSPSGIGSAPGSLLGPGGASAYLGEWVATAGDVNGDGYADVIVAANGLAENAIAYLYLGGPTGLATTPATTLTGPSAADDYYGAIVASAGDVNGDGYADVIVGAEGPPAYVGSAYFYPGGPTGLGGAPKAAREPTVILGTAIASANGLTMSGVSVGSAGDENGDGYADVFVAVESALDAQGDTLPSRVDVYLGGASGLAIPSTITLSDPGNDWYVDNFGTCAFGASD